MTGDARTATFETRHADETVAAVVADALAPDNTPEMHTETDGDTVRTEIERASTGGLHASSDDYLVNLSVADTVVGCARRLGSGGADDTRDSDGTSEDSNEDKVSEISETHDNTDTHE